MNNDLSKTAQFLVQRGKGLLAADESSASIEKRFAALNIPSSPETHRIYRQLLFEADGIDAFISGVILFDETIRQSTDENILFSEYLKKKGMIPGIKVDQGLQPFSSSSTEKITSGLDGLPDRLAEYYRLGARFTKWRAVSMIGEGLPTIACIDENAARLAEFARYSQEAGLVPITEAETLMDGDHTIERCGEVTVQVLRSLFINLEKERVRLDEMLLKCNMIVPGKGSSQNVSHEEVAQMTTSVLKETVSSKIAGVMFLSGGQTEDEATERLNEICKYNNLHFPVTFSFSRGLQNSALKTWSGKDENIVAAQKTLYRRAQLLSLASKGEYSSEKAS